jgi:catechol 2,3-dioxygenase-like lactoylglutathione lyase family enzyme
MSTAFHRVIPELAVPDVPTTLSWYRDVLGDRIEGQTEDVFGSVLRGRANFYISKSDAAQAAPPDWVFVDEVDQLCESFQACGATILEPPHDTPWGYRQFTLEDLNGYRFYYFRFLDNPA